MDVQDIERLGPVTFSICVMWISGWSISRISLITERSAGSIRGIVHRKLAVSRDDMTFEDRQALLLLMKEHRQDDGKLPDKVFKANSLQAAQKARRVNPKPEVEAAEERAATLAAMTPQQLQAAMTERSRQAKKQKKEDNRTRQYAEARREEREAGNATQRGERASALEFLANRKMLADYQDRINETLGPQKLTSTGVYRLECGHRLRNYFDGERIGGMGAVDYGRSGGGGGANALPLSAYRLQCIHALGEIKTLMTREEFLLIERLVDHDEFLWEAFPEDRRRPVFDTIRRTLDIVAVYERLIDQHTYYSRWGMHLPMITRIKRGAVQKQSREAARVLAGAKR